MTQTVRAVTIRQHGGPEVMEIEDRALGEPGPGEVRIRHHAIGLNFIDVYQRSGLYQMPLPAALGQEGAGIVEAVGDGVTHLKAGDRAAYAGGPAGAYAEARILPAGVVVPLPDGISFEEGAAVMLKGLTVQFLFRRTTPLAPGDTVLFQAAAGGVGLIACQWARSEGIRLIGTAGSAEKCALALEHGASEAINYREADVAAEVKRLTDGRGVDVVMDGVGRDTFDASLDCLRPLGMMISFGNASGKVPPVDIMTLAAKGSLQLTRPTMFTHVADPATCRAMAADLFGKIESGAIRVRIDQRFPLDQVQEAHRALEGRATTGSTVLIP
ncbi:quinone oxidoreductase [Rubellimicrobium rubrum]|uniref:Quinone oxidoreductase n=1 Tax=Rubellimicrobium rubrum TaxID=2585369 RepID=A0A5C4N4R5_9RHOB|nr:quinone oxidoreductase [Rubellimicrobium rubrum]TNC52008.1 quinone oxidoreductase [Rubellimicrobium rubrum]